MSGNGDVNFVLVGRSTTALAMASRETTATPPQLVITSGGGGGGDVTPPSVPTGVNGAPVGSTEIDLSWNASTDNAGGSGVAGYNVFRGGSKVNGSLVTTTNFADTGLLPSTQYSYTVSAVDNQDERVGAVVAAEAGDDRLRRRGVVARSTRSLIRMSTRVLRRRTSGRT